ncbi:MAG: GTPase Era [Chitinophagales bacterium]|nr:GTPase Era [Chitinophagales bacterium]MDW8393494.1 GTPase Era [Chitinophagales bacterium]
MSAFRSGYVVLIGLPNAGKSTLLNALIGEKVSITSPRPQTTRHRIAGILSSPDYQLILVDTPGLLTPAYLLHEHLMTAVQHALRDADAVLILPDATQPAEQLQVLADAVGTTTLPVVVAINKTDAADARQVASLSEAARLHWPMATVLDVSALQGLNLDRLVSELVRVLPEHPPYFPDGQLTDRTERFLASELIREVIFHQYHQEIPYSTEVIVNEWREEPGRLRISADIWVERESQKAILLGRGGAAIRQLGISARTLLEKQLGKPVVLLLTVKVVGQWRKKPALLKKLGFSA